VLLSARCTICFVPAPRAPSTRLRCLAKVTFASVFTRTLLSPNSLAGRSPNSPDFGRLARRSEFWRIPHVSINSRLRPTRIGATIWARRGGRDACPAMVAGCESTCFGRRVHYMIDAVLRSEFPIPLLSLLASLFRLLVAAIISLRRRVGIRRFFILLCQSELLGGRDFDQWPAT